MTPVASSASKLQERRRRILTTTRVCHMMIVRSLLRAQAPKTVSRRVFRVASRPIKTARRYSTSNASMASSTPQSQASMLATITIDLDKIAPRFEIQPDQITIIQTPSEFYETLKVGLQIPSLHVYEVLYSSVSMFS
jgi:CDP-diacylglycerol--glycerol-3-phosphate 3-phosphatidyltransferase